MKTNIEETYDSGDRSNQIPIIHIADKLHKEQVLVYNKQQPKLIKIGEVGVLVY